MKRAIFFTLLILAGCHHSNNLEQLAFIQIQDRNGLTETISNPTRLQQYTSIDFASAQPYKKVLRVFKEHGKNRSKITTYYPNGTLFQYLEAEEMRANGPYYEWFANGQIKIEAKVIGGTADIAPSSQSDWLFDGLCKAWDEKGNLIAEISYDKGALNGKNTYFFSSGCIEKVLPF